MGEHTPGPWQAIEWSCHAPTTIVARIGDANIVVAECSGHGRHSNESLGDARLIAAAPETLKALENLLAYLRAFWPLEPLFSTYDDRQALEIADAESVIRKARGEQ